MNKGISRKARKSEALNTSYISVDERSALDLLQFTLKFSQYLNFYGSANKVVANWQSFLLKDSVFIIALICSTNLNKYRLTADSGSLENETKKQIEDAITGMEEIVLNWHNLLKQINDKSNLFNELDSVVQSFNDKKTKTQKRSVLESDKETYENIFGNIVFIQSKASKWFEDELKKTNHHPHIGLILTFLELYKNAQSDINTLTQKHLDYYFRDLLKQNNKNLTAHSAIVSIGLQSGLQQLYININDKFEFIFKGNTPILFETDSQTQINKTQIAEIKTLFKENYQPFGYNSNPDNFAINTLFQADIMKDGVRISSNNDFSREHYPATLGEPINNEKSFNDNFKMSELGVVVSSPALVLEKGKQNITITFKITPQSYNETRELFNGLVKEEIKQLTRKIVDEKKLRRATIAKFLRSAFHMFTSHETGWVRIEDYVVKANPDNYTLTFDVHLNEFSDVLGPYNIELHEGNFNTEWPCIKILMNNDAQYQPYKLLKNLIIEDISINASVSEVNELQLTNLLGKLDCTIPIQPFGPAPAVGNFFALHNPTILQKHLSSLEFVINWSGLPLNRKGFEDYYQDYPFTIDNGSFKALITQNKNNIGSAETEKQQFFQLFDMKGDYLSNGKVLKIDLDSLNFTNQRISVKETDKQNTNPLYIVLTEPRIAFGHQIYPEIYAEAALESSRFKKSKVKLPAQPFTPVIEHLKVNYSNSVREIMYRKQDLRDSDVKLFHIHPFGHVQAFPGPVKSQFFLFPQINYTGNLYLGLEHAKPDDLVNIGFELVSAVYQHSVIQVPEIEWQYLLNNEWVNMNDLKLEDGTNGLLQSGIVKIQIPKVVQTNNTRLPLGKFWLRAVYNGTENLNSKIIKVFTQAILLKSGISIPEATKNTIVAETIEKISAQGLTGIDKINGPYALIISESTESNDSYYCRVSEQMRHKNRASANWDVERLVLDKFKQIEKIRVYGRNSHPNELVKGCDMQIVLIPKNTMGESSGSQNSGIAINTLKEVKQYVSQFVSPHVKIEVSNPVYEYLKVRCSVRFTDKQKSGYYRNLLNSALIGYLSPDIGTEFIEKGFDESISKAEIQNFIESQPYVNSIKQFSVLQLIEVQDEYRIIDTAKIQAINELRTITPYAILTSAPMHQITEDTFESSSSGVDDLSVGIDFIISDNEGNYI